MSFIESILYENARVCVCVLGFYRKLDLRTCDNANFVREQCPTETP